MYRGLNVIKLRKYGRLKVRKIKYRNTGENTEIPRKNMKTRKKVRNYGNTKNNNIEIGYGIMENGKNICIIEIRIFTTLTPGA